MNTQRLVAIVVVFLFSPSVWAQSVGNTKTWKFSLPHGSLEIRAEKTSSGSVVLGFAPDGSIPEAPVLEQVGALKQVLSQMPQFGFDPRQLTSIGTHLYGRDVSEKLAYACADSTAWLTSMKNGGKGKERLVVELLNQSGAFEPLNEAFKPYGIEVHVTEAEKVGLMRFSQVPPRDSRDRTKARLLVPADAMLGMRFSRIHGLH